MVTETQKRIEAYRELLPGLREKVTAVAFLLALSVIMLTSASYAWLTISRAPEVTAVSTNIAANGSLEIALATGDGTKEPDPSKVGDSSAAEGQNIVNANKTWGNLINLNDPSYGLDDLVLRPAQLNTAALLESPLWGAEYYGDGRISKLDSNFRYTVWDGNYFAVPELEQFGVRAISSAEYQADNEAGGEIAIKINEAKNVVSEKNLEAITKYQSLANNTYMQSLATMMGLYMTARMNPDEPSLNNPSVAIADIENLKNMYGEFVDCFVLEAEAIAELIDFSLRMKNYSPENPSSFDNYVSAYEAIDVLGYIIEKDEDNNVKFDENGNFLKTEISEKIKQDTLNKLGVQIGNSGRKNPVTGPTNSFTQFINDYNTVVNDYIKLVKLCEGGTSLKWTDSGINNIVNNLVNVGACTIGANNTPISSIGASNAASYLRGTQEARITNGILYRFEERIGGFIDVKELAISATVKRMGITIPATVKANIKTTAAENANDNYGGKYIFDEDMAVVQSVIDNLGLPQIFRAKDTYGLAVDFWVRTNSAGSYLTLEGNVLTEENEVRATGKDANGNTVELYTVTINGTDEESGESFSYSLDLYQVIDDNKTIWHNIDNHAVVTEEELNKNTPMPKMETVVTVVGYEGDNRVWSDVETWEDNPYGLSLDSTTQGSGSCYVYYADTPEDMERSLKLLESFKVAFVDREGILMTTAEMDTKNYFAESGRVTVPLVLSSDSINLGEDFEGNITYAITALEQNEPTRITAIVYLDGTKLTNSEVLSAADIQGQLNIQFGSSQSLEPIRNEDLESKELRVSASVVPNEFDYDKATGPMTSTFTVNVDGDEPSSVTAYLIRKVNETQGSREAELTFNGSGNTRTCDYTFTTPGTYILRTVSLDGVDHDLSQGELPTVTVKGFMISSFNCDQATNNHVNVFTAENSATVNLSMKFATDDRSKLPETVQARFLSENGAVNADFVYNPTNQTWNATATFHSSGLYELKYVVLNGEIKELDPDMWQTASITLGMRVAVYTTSPHKFKYVPSEMTPNQKNLAMQVKILDNAGNELLGLSEAKLTYTMKGSGVKKMDTDLEWDGSYYSGSFPCGGPGIWQFSKVTVGENTLTTATTSPTFTIQSPEPPEYVRHNTSSYQYKPNNDATMNVLISNSSAATVQAYIIKNGAAEGTWVDGVLSNETTTGEGKPANYWNFNVPKDANVYQDGHWTLTQLKIWDVFAADGTAYTQEAPLEIDVSNENNKTKVVSRVYVTFAPGQSKHFGKENYSENGEVTGEFMDSHTITELNVDFIDFEGENVSGVTDVQLKFEYVNQSSETCGGYGNNSLTNATQGATVTVSLTDEDEDGHFEQEEEARLLYAGNYNTTFTYKVNGTTVTNSGKDLPENAPTFTVWSKAPTVTIASISPSGSHKSMAVSGRDYKLVDVNSSIEGNTVTIYAGMTAAGSTIGTTPSVTLQINNLGKAESANLKFTASGGGTVYMYTGTGMSNRTDTYSWTNSSLTYSLYIGQYKSSRTCQSMSYEGAGTLTSNNYITIKYEDKDYTVAINPITIINNNPPY